MKKNKISLILILSFLFLSSFAAESGMKNSLDLSIEKPLPPAAHIDVEFVKQLPDYCGEACFVMALETFGINVTQEDIHEASGLKKKRGCYSTDLVRAGLKLRVDAECYWIEGFKTLEERNHYLDALKYFVSLNYPVIISWNEDPEDHDYSSFEHFVLTVGYDDESDEMKIMDPYTGPAEGRKIAYTDFLEQWQWRNRSGTYGLFMYVIKGRVE